MKCIYIRIIVATSQLKTLLHSRAFASQQLPRVFRDGARATSCHLQKVMCITLMLSLMATTTPAAPQTIVALPQPFASRRHGFTGTIQEYPWGITFVGHTTDGTFIDYSYTSGTGGGIVWAQAKLPNGTIINYGAPGPGAVYPTSIEDPNGNFITITYVNNSGPRIQSIADTLNRPISFHYDANSFLTAITGPGLDNTERTLVRLNYRQISLNYSFSGLTPGVRNPQR